MTFRHYNTLTVITTLFLFTGIVGCRASHADKKSKICFKDQCFNVEIADTQEAQIRGLQFRTELAPDAGMLFVFSEDKRYAFWMKDTLIPLDMIWLDKNMHVVHIQKNVPPCEYDPCPSYTPALPARYVLELNAGATDTIGLKTDDVLKRK